MSRSLLHDWEPSIENLSVEMSKIAKDIYNTAYARGKNHPDEVLYTIRAEIANLEEGISSYHNDRPWVFKDEVLKIIDKYMIESEERDYEKGK